MEAKCEPKTEWDPLNTLQCSKEPPATDKPVDSKRKHGEICPDDITTVGDGDIASGSGIRKNKKGANKSRKRKNKVKHYTIMNRPTTLSKFALDYEPKNICIASQASAWVCGRQTSHLELLKNDGTVKKSIELDVKVNGICIHPLTGELYCTCQKDVTVRRIDTESGTTDILFTTLKESGEDKISSFFTDPKTGDVRVIDDTVLAPICCTKDNTFIVGMHNRVCMYAYDGKLLHDNFGFYNCPNDISVWHETDTVAITHSSSVVVTGMDLKEKRSFSRTYGKRRKVIFRSSCAVFDGKGSMLVGCPTNSEIHVVKGDSTESRTTFHTDDMTKVIQLRLQEDGLLWVGCHDTNQIMLLKYSKGA